jgi:cellulose synthase/poly-beta-1,6-N-acetylglucosamine synthase-like glycosyltransferase
MSPESNKFGNILLRLGYISQEQLETVLKQQSLTGQLLGELLVEKGYLSQDQLTEYIIHSKLSKLGEKLIHFKAITPDQLKIAIDFQEINGGRLGDILISLNFIEKEYLLEIINSYPKIKIPLGEMLVRNNEITDDELNNALKLQQKSGGLLGDILLFLKYISPENLYKYLANQSNVGRIGNTIHYSISQKLPYEIAIKYNAIIINSRKSSYILAVKDILSEESLKEIEKYVDKPLEQVLATMLEIENLWFNVYSNKQAEKSVFELYEQQPENSAIVTFTAAQKILIIVICLSMLSLVAISYKYALFIINIFFQSIYAFMTILKLRIVLKGSTKNHQLKFTDDDVNNIDEKDLPIYTILVPVYKEKEVIRHLLNNIQKIDYPQYKLDVCILLEEDDVETIAIVNSMNLPYYFRPIIVPHSIPKTKPKACNYGLIRSRGEYCVIFDAEDRPEADQLKKAYLSFKSLPDNYVCIQGKLNYFNSNQNTLTKLFTQEYSMWFELLLVGIMQLDIPIPLGGTSNHFKTSFLREVGAWDPFNVTEDADLGIRLFKYGYKTAILDSRTWEEANSKPINWIRQRSRWIKGYMQTWFVHMRNPVKLYKDLGFKGFIGYQAMILGTPLLPIINPIFWSLLILWYITKAPWISMMFPGIFYYIANFQLIFGNFMFTYTNALGMYWVIRDSSLKKSNSFSYSLIKYALLSPFYWILMSIAAYKALIQLIVNPFYWEKTIHGLASDEEKISTDYNYSESI